MRIGILLAHFIPKAFNLLEWKSSSKQKSVCSMCLTSGTSETKEWCLMGRRLKWSLDICVLKEDKCGRDGSRPWLGWWWWCWWWCLAIWLPVTATGFKESNDDVVRMVFVQCCPGALLESSASISVSLFMVDGRHSSLLDCSIASFRLVPANCFIFNVVSSQILHCEVHHSSGRALPNCHCHCHWWPSRVPSQNNRKYDE